MRRFVGVGLFAIVLAGCNSSTDPGLLTFEGRHNVLVQSPLTVEGVVTVRNVGHEPTTIAAPNDCNLTLEAFTTAERTGQPVWRSNVATACTAEARIMTLAPGDYYDFKTTGTIPTTLPHARYYLAVWGASTDRHVPVGVIDFF
jgi:hypothetical protein